jgi:hypothetical protein
MSGLLIAIATAALTGSGQVDEPAGAPVPDAEPDTQVSGADSGADRPQAADLAGGQSSLEVSFLAGVWLPRMVGKVALDDGEIQVHDEFELNRSEATLNLELAVRKNEFWELWFGGFDFSSTASGPFRGDGKSFGSLVLNNGTQYTSRFEMTSVATDLSVAVWRPFADGHAREQGADNRNWNGRYIADLRFCPQFGMRYIDVDHTVTTAGGTERAGGEWLAVYAGLLLEMDYRPQERTWWLALLRIQGSFAAGPALGGDGGTMWQVRAGATVQVTEALGFMFGYRLVELNVENAGYTLDGGLQGLFIAGSLKF